jgi:peptidoglycan hydrolase-like protein with peptidoglycan-binding domain
MAKKLLNCGLILFLVFNLISVLPNSVEAKGSRRTAKTKSSASRKSGAKKARSSKSGSKSASSRKSSRTRSPQRASSSRRGKRGRSRGANYAQNRRYTRVSGPASAMPSDRVREIQEALKREGYYQGEPNGQYDKATVDAMSGYQKSKNLRTTGYPTAEVLHNLGLTKKRVAPPAPGETRGEAATPQTQITPTQESKNN